MAVVLVATLDTKGHELGHVRGLLRSWGHATIVIDAGALGAPAIEPDISRERVFEAAGTTAEAVRLRGDRGQAVAAASKGVAAVVKELHAQGKVDAILGIGGGAGTTIGTRAMRALPFGVPKLMLSTLASGQVRPYVGGSDLLMMHSVADLAGLNQLTRTVLGNAAAAVRGMIESRPGQDQEDGGPVLAATMFGVTTRCVDQARTILEKAGCEVLVFHATGVGGQSMETLVRDGKIQAVLDLTTTEIADEVVGGILSAGPDRLRAAGRAGIPQVVSTGALDMVNFGPIQTVPERFRERRLHVHNENVTLLRTTPEENARIGAFMAEALGDAKGPVVLVLPLGGVSAIDVPGQPFHDPEADAALFEALRVGLRGRGQVEIVERPEAINDPAFAAYAAERMLGFCVPQPFGAWRLDVESVPGLPG